MTESLGKRNSGSSSAKAVWWGLLVSMGCIVVGTCAYIHFRNRAAVTTTGQSGNAVEAPKVPREEPKVAGYQGMDEANALAERLGDPLRSREQRDEALRIIKSWRH